jgi:hypothetical protein
MATNSTAIISEPVRWESMVRVVPSMDAVANVAEEEAIQLEQ